MMFKIKGNFNVGIAWIWIRNSLLIFYKKPSYFLYFALIGSLLSILPILGSFFATLLSLRILLASVSVSQNNPISMNLHLNLLVRQRNVLAFAIFNIGFDLILLSVISNLIDPITINSITSLGTISPQVIYLFIIVNLIKLVFFGISPAIILFNHDLGILASLQLSWVFIFKNFIVLFLALIVIFAGIAIPWYLISLFGIAMMHNMLVFSLCFVLMIIISLSILAIINIFMYVLYVTCISRS